VSGRGGSHNVVYNPPILVSAMLTVSNREPHEPLNPMNPEP
jgi:hypothetical protein